MSYILDALKKSDQERKQGDIPNLQTVHVSIAQEQSKPWVLYGMLLVLLLALAFIIGFLISGKNEVNKVNSVEIEKPAISNAETLSPAKINNQDLEGESSKVEPGAMQVVDPKKEVDKVVAAPVQDESLNVVRRETQSTVDLTDLSDIPYLHELPAYQQQLIPEMGFAGHVYSSAASSRSVIINGNAMSEGDSLLSGLVVEQITSTGVVVSFNEVVFRVDVLQDWSFE